MNLLLSLDDFTNYWYSFVNILEFILTVISLINLISEIYIDNKDNTSSKINQKFHTYNNQKTTDTLQRIRYSSMTLLF